jgi:hypothetical protein
MRPCLTKPAQDPRNLFAASVDESGVRRRINIAPRYCALASNRECGTLIFPLLWDQSPPAQALT